MKRSPTNSKSKKKKIQPVSQSFKCFNGLPIEFTFKGEPVTKSNNGQWFHGHWCFPARIKNYEKALKVFVQDWMKKK